MARNGYHQISFEVDEATFQRKKSSGMDWGAIVGFGFETPELRFKIRELETQLYKMNIAYAKAKREIRELEDAQDVVIQEGNTSQE